MKQLLACLAFLSFSSFAQTITIKKIELAGEKIIVHYDLDDNNPNNEYLLNLYASKDNFAAPLTKVAGDVGMDIKPGVGKKIEWSIIDEYGGYKGKLSLEVRGRVYVPFVRLMGFDTKKAYKRGRSHTINWRPGNSNPINIELYKGGQRIAGDVNQPNNGNYSLFIPAHAQTGKDYRLKMTDTRNLEEVIYTDMFRVTPKVSLVLKVVPVAVVGVIVYFLTRNPPPPPPEGIPDPDFPD